MPRPSYASVVSTLCLALILGGGTAYAAGLGRNTVGSAQIKNGQVKSVDIRNNAVVGADVLESSLSGVNAAKIGGLEVKKVRYQRSAGAGSTTVLSFPGHFRLDASCVSSDLEVTLVSLETGLSAFASSTNQFAADEDGTNDLQSNHDDAINGGESFSVDVGDESFGTTRIIDLRVAGNSGFAADVHLYYEGGTPLGQCRLTGIGIGG